MIFFIFVSNELNCRCCRLSGSRRRRFRLRTP
jgi:hypothetical protein